MIFTMDELLVSTTSRGRSPSRGPPFSSLQLFWAKPICLLPALLFYLDAFVLCHPLDVLSNLLGGVVKSEQASLFFG